MTKESALYEIINELDEALENTEGFEPDDWFDGFHTCARLVRARLRKLAEQIGRDVRESSGLDNELTGL